jgi:serine/threonine-protein kinase
MGCLDEQEVKALLAGNAPAELRARADRHVAGCGWCHLVLGNYTRGTAQTRVDGAADDGDDTTVGLGQRAPFAPGTTVDGRYRLEGYVASGGMSEVWTATDTTLDVLVVLKFLSSGLVSSPDARARFEREAKAAARLRSHHVVTMYGHGTHRGVPYIAMELLEGEDLGARIERRGRLDLNESAELATQMARGIERAHELGIVHRDLKPSNVFLAFVDGVQTVKLLDFGLAKTMSSEHMGSLTRTGQVMGTLQYMSPEQVIGDKAIDHRADLWSFGVILFRAVTGHRAIEASTMVHAVSKIVLGQIPRATELAPDLPIELDAFFAKALSLSRDSRFQSATEMARAFADIAARDAASNEADTEAFLDQVTHAQSPSEDAGPEPQEGEAETEILRRPK